ncbi:guanine nucleotide-binding protein [Achlya hypogyna]|uniref:Guanine nucleotide-binding protein-like 1 n=1 Tax=Achlya hypogyna TaxID=1202772 RepID=A0A1V9YD53_ACHHY|nr:guanine nucleotide-binding protein [Achlya hypogyna]
MSGMEGMAKRLQEATLMQRKRDEIDALKAKRIERSKGPASAFSGKQKKQQMREKKARVKARKEEMDALETTFVDGTDEPLDVDNLQGIRTANLKLTVALGRQSKDLLEKQLSSFFVKETKEQIQLRIMEGQYPLDLSKRNKPLLWTELNLDPLLNFPQRPAWNYKQSKERVQDNESIMFDTWLANIHNKYEPEELNHFEHNLEVWRELWRVFERSTHLVIVADIRNPLLHIPPSVYDYITETLQRPLMIVLNKIDLIPWELTICWRDFLNERFPKAQLLFFSSRSKSIHDQVDLAGRRKVLSEKLKVGDVSAVQGAVGILVGCGIPSERAQEIINSVLDDDDEEDVDAGIHATTTPARRARRKIKAEKAKKAAMKPDQQDDLCDYCGMEEPVAVCSECSELFRDMRLCAGCNKDVHKTVKHKVTLLDTHLEPTAEEIAAKQVTTIGLIGHPNVGKSSVLNALAGKKLVSVSHTPGHTKRLQTIFVAPEICICDCPGLVFPFVGVPKHMQELCGLFPYAQIREPYSAVRYLAEHCALEDILNLVPRVQHFDGVDEPLEWSPWTLCEAYAEKKGYKTDRRGRPDHHRAGAELIRDCMDGILPLFFYPPKYTGAYFDGTNNKQYCGYDAVAKLNVIKTTAAAPIVESDNEDDGESESEDEVVEVKKAGFATNNMYLLDDSSSDED